MTKKEVLPECRRIAFRALGFLKVSAETPDIVFANANAMRRLEATYAGKHKKTVDVLAFPEVSGFPRPESRKKILGEIYLNWDEGKKNTARLFYLVVHATLHLLGYEHDKKADILRMKKLETTVCRHILSSGWTSELQVSKRLAPRYRAKK